LLVEAQTDASSSDAYNQRLSERRAGTVQKYLTLPLWDRLVACKIPSQ
jgi:outer membrane protein OmpA-like peptidoglycan-associated protein